MPRPSLSALPVQAFFPPSPALLLVIVLAVGVLLAAPRFTASDRTGRHVDQRMTHSVSAAGEAMSPIFASGQVEGGRPNVELRFQVAGSVAALGVKEGQAVTLGQPLLQLDDRQLRQEMQLAASGLRLAQAERARLENGARSQERAEAESLYRAKLAELENAQLAWDRVRQLRADDVIAQQEADNKRSQFAALQAQVAAARARVELLEAPARDDELQMATARIDAAAARLELAQLQLERAQLTSPIDGQVLEINLEAGELTGPDAGEPAIVLADTSRTRVRAFVEELDAARVQIGMPAIVTADALPGRQFTGHVGQMSPHMTRKQLFTDRPTERFDTKLRQVWIELDNATDLVLGLRVDVSIEAPAIASAIH